MDQLAKGLQCKWFIMCWVMRLFGLTELEALCNSVGRKTVWFGDIKHFVEDKKPNSIAEVLKVCSIVCQSTDSFLSEHVIKLKISQKIKWLHWSNVMTCLVHSSSHADLKSFSLSRLLLSCLVHWLMILYADVDTSGFSNTQIKSLLSLLPQYMHLSIYLHKTQKKNIFIYSSSYVSRMPFF